MSGGQWMVILIVAMVMVAGVLKARYGAGRDRHGNPLATPGNDAETQRLREEVKVLKERLQVIERITVEKESSLEREIERLRDR